MCHPLYPVASRMVGRSVIAHHVSGRTYPGYLQSVQHHGIYLLPHARRVGYETSDPSRLETQHAIANQSHLELEQVFAPAAFFGFGALTGLTLGALAFGGGYGYGYGYPGYY
jgi:hypothetical protein